MDKVEYFFWGDGLIRLIEFFSGALHEDLPAKHFKIYVIAFERGVSVVFVCYKHIVPMGRKCGMLSHRSACG